MKKIVFDGAVPVEERWVGSPKKKNRKKFVKKTAPDVLWDQPALKKRGGKNRRSESIWPTTPARAKFTTKNEKGKRFLVLGHFGKGGSVGEKEGGCNCL